MPKHLTSGLINAYLARLGLKREPPSAAALSRLHRAHVERIPYETLWIHQVMRWGISPHESATRIATTGRGGYCFHLNGAFSLLLESLGYLVERFAGAVHRDEHPDPADVGNHLVLTVRELPDESNLDGTWYVDAGLGDAIHEPLPLSPADVEQGPFTYRLETSPAGPDAWRFTNDPTAGFRYMSWAMKPVAVSRFQAPHISLSTSPESGFVRVLTLQRRDATGADTIRGRTLRRIGTGSFHTVLDSRDDLEAALVTVFGIDPKTVTSLDRIWADACIAHEHWLASLERS